MQKENQMVKSKEYKFKNIVVKVNNIFLNEGKTLEERMEKLIEIEVESIAA